MSGGFFRGTSADQDTRFSNKQAKLLKSQKFAPELENLVDMTKVKMDVMKPWIAKRVTELIGFEDEVLINFIYSLLEGKAVNGKQIQISLTGFMERNTGKFMKELWALLLSAQQNVSGVPQQFLDAKEEETKKKKAETDRITNEIQRKKEKEKQEFEEEKAKMDDEVAKSRDKNSELEPNVKHNAGGSTIQSGDEKERYKRNGRRRSIRGSQSPGSPYHSSSRERRRSRSISHTPPSRSRSTSLERRDRSSLRRSVSPRRRHINRRSPSPWRRSSTLKRRSRSRSRRRSPSPAWYRVRSPRRHKSRSPLRRRSRSPVRRRSRTPIRRSPVWYRSRTPLRRRSPSPMQGRSPSPIRRGRTPSFLRRKSPSPVRRRSPSPVRRRSPSPVRRRSPSPVRRRSPSPPSRQSQSPLQCSSPSPHRHSPSPHRHSPLPARRQPQRSLSRSISPVRRRSSIHGRKRSIPPGGRSPSPQESSSPSHISRGSLSPMRRKSMTSARSPVQSPRERTRRREKYFPARRASPDERAELPSENHKAAKYVERRPLISLRSPQRDMLDRSDLHGKPRYLSPSMEKSPNGLHASRGRSDIEGRRSITPGGSPYKMRGRIVQPESPSPLRKAAEAKARQDSSGTSVDDESNISHRDIEEVRYRSSGKISPTPVHHKGSHDNVESRSIADRTKSRKSQLPNSDGFHDTVDHKEHRGRQESSTTSKKTGVSVKSRESYDDGARAKDKKLDWADEGKVGYQIPQSEGLPKLSRKSDQNDQNGSLDSPSRETDGHRAKVNEKRKHKNLERQDVESDDYSSYDSHEGRKEAKRRRKEEKKLKKEERRRRREDKRRRKGGRRAEKLKLKSDDADSLSPDLASDNSEDEGVKRRYARASNSKETESEQKKLEIELREKALESLRAKKGI